MTASVTAAVRERLERVRRHRAARRRAGHPQPGADAGEAYRDFGSDSGHPARLNFGDCFAYVLAETSREPLLYEGDDFGKTDLQSARIS